MPSTLPFAVHYLCGDNYSGLNAFPNTEIQPSAQRDNLLAASLLLNDQNVSEAELRGKEMTSRIRMAMELKRESQGCLECKKVVRLN